MHGTNGWVMHGAIALSLQIAVGVEHGVLISLPFPSHGTGVDGGGTKPPSKHSAEDGHGAGVTAPKPPLDGAHG